MAGWFQRRPRQRVLPFQGRRERHERIFRGTIVVLTALGLLGIWAALAPGRSALLAWGQSVQWSALRRVGLEPPRGTVDDYWRDRRQQREARTRARFRGLFAKLTPERQALLRVAGMGPDDAIIRWGNYDLTLMMSSQVFERDDHGRYYRLRPDARSVIIRQIHVFDMDTCQFIVPATPEVLSAVERAGATVVPGSEMSTNSWGCRGPEPDLAATVRGLVLGDSFMQGYFIGDDQTPPACLQRCLQAALGVPVSILNTGTLGYSPEHEYHTLMAYAERFKPRFVVVSLFPNDFGLEHDVVRGEGDWEEGGFWLLRIRDYCRAHGILCLFVPVPFESQLTGARNSGHYPGQVANLTQTSGPLFYDPLDVFVNENLTLRRDDLRAGRRVPERSPLYNGQIGDGHFSPRGAALWGRVVAERLALILESKR